MNISGTNIAGQLYVGARGNYDRMHKPCASWTLDRKSHP